MQFFYTNRCVQHEASLTGTLDMASSYNTHEKKNDNNSAVYHIMF